MDKALFCIRIGMMSVFLITSNTIPSALAEQGEGPPSDTQTPADEISPEADTAEPTPPSQTPDTPSPSESPKAIDIPDDTFLAIQKDPYSYLGNIRYEDIVVVQKRYLRKDDRWFAKGFGAGGNFFSHFSTTWVHGVGGGYYFSDAIGWEFLHLLFGSSILTDRTELFLKKFELKPIDFEFRTRLLASSAIQWTFTYGKLAFHNTWVVHYDSYLFAGPAAVIYENTLGFGGVLGLGMQFFLNQWLGLGIELREYLYFETTPKAQVDKGVAEKTTFEGQFFICAHLTVYFPKFAFLEGV